MRALLLALLLLSSGCLGQCGAIGGGVIGPGAALSGPVVLDVSDGGPAGCGSVPGSPSLHYAARLETEYADTDVVPAATDQGSLGVNATQANGGAQPTFVSDCINGLPCYSFDGGDYLASASFTALSQANTVAIVARPDVITSNQPRLFGGIETGNRHHLYSPTGKWTMFAGSNANSALTPVAGQWESIVADFDDTSSAILVSGTSETGLSPGTHTLTGVTLGARFAGFEPMTGALAEVIVYDTPPDAAEVETYLECLYGEFPISSFALPFTARDAANDDVEIDDVWQAGVAA